MLVREAVDRVLELDVDAFRRSRTASRIQKVSSTFAPVDGQVDLGGFDSGQAEVEPFCAFTGEIGDHDLEQRMAAGSRTDDGLHDRVEGHVAVLQRVQNDVPRGAAGASAGRTRQVDAQREGVHEPHQGLPGRAAPCRP